MNDFRKIEADLKKLPPSKQQLAQKLLDKAKFMDEELEGLQVILKEKGWTETYQNGANQCGLKKSSEGEVYNTLIKSFNTTMKQINDMLDAVVTAEEDDELMAFLKGNKKPAVVR